MPVIPITQNSLHFAIHHIGYRHIYVLYIVCVHVKRSEPGSISSMIHFCGIHLSRHAEPTLTTPALNISRVLR